jgi:hypothetical protein
LTPNEPQKSEATCDWLNQWNLARKISTSRGNAFEHHRKLRGAFEIIFLIGLGVLTFQGFTTPAMLTSDYTDVLGPEESFTFVPPTTTFYLPRLPAASHDYLLPSTTICCLSRLPAPSQDYLPPPTTTCCQLLVPRCACLEKGLRHLALDCFYYSAVTAQKPR